MTEVILRHHSKHIKGSWSMNKKPAPKPAPKPARRPAPRPTTPPRRGAY